MQATWLTLLRSQVAQTCCRREQEPFAGFVQQKCILVAVDDQIEEAY